VKLLHNFFENPQSEKKKIKNFRTSKYQNKRLSKFSKEKQILHRPLVKLHTNKFKIPKMTRRKIEDFKFSKWQNKKLLEERQILLSPSL
jgi:hypothetical protein